MGQQYFHQETSKHSLKNQRLNDNLSKMPKIRHHGQGSKLYSGKLRSPPQLFDKLGQKTNDMDSEKGDNLNTDSLALNGEASSKMNLNFRKDEAHPSSNTLSLQEDFDKIEKLSMINANARYELINANQ